MKMSVSAILNNKDAQDRHNRIVFLVTEIKKNFLTLGEQLYHFELYKNYKQLGYETFESYLADPIVDIGRSTAFRLKAIYKKFVLDLKVPPVGLLEVSQAKLDTIMPHVTEGNVDEWVNKASSLSRSDLKKEVKDEFGAEWYQSSESDDWWTPQWLFETLNDEFGFETDVCASHVNAKCDNYYTREQDGLMQIWKGVCWMNPPYGTEIGLWMAKAKDSAEHGATVVCLIPARTDTNWWWDNVIYGEVRFIKGRLHFDNSGNSAPFPSAICVFYPGLPDNPKVIWWNNT